MTPEELSALIRAQLLDAARAGDVGLGPADVPERVRVERPRDREHGDWATNVALQLASRAGVAPRELARRLADRLAGQPGIARVDVAGPGFVNIRLEAASAGLLARQIVERGTAFGRSRALAGRRVNLEYVSANPTGPIHIGGARWAAVGDSLARLLAACGAQVTREYYFNDHGTQIDRFARSLRARALGLPAPEDGYAGAYVGEIEQQVRGDAQAAGEPDPAGLPEAESLEAFRARGVDIMFAQIKSRLHEFRADFDVFFHEQSLYDSGAVQRAFDRLRGRGLVYRSDGATWLSTSRFGDDKDRVLVKSNGETTYFAADVAYYLDKRRRGADVALYLLGADHHGYIGRMMAMCRAFGDTPGENMQILIGQMVNLIKNGEPVRMSKRAGNIVTLDDLVDAVGVDAARYSLVRESMDSNIDLDLDLVASHTNENPVYYVQYAHARCASVDRHALEHGVRRDAGFAAGALDQPADAELLGVLAQFPQVVAQAADTREPHRVARYLEGLASAYHQWYGQCRVTPRADEAVTAGHVARLWLNDAVAQVLANGLTLLGVDAPDRM